MGREINLFPLNIAKKEWQSKYFRLKYVECVVTEFCLVVDQTTKCNTNQLPVCFGDGKLTMIEQTWNIHKWVEMVQSVQIKLNKIV